MNTAEAIEFPGDAAARVTDVVVVLSVAPVTALVGIVVKVSVTPPSM
jgi:hypothetical protein